MGKKGKPLFFKGSTFHRVIPQFMLQVNSAPTSVPCRICESCQHTLSHSLVKIRNKLQGGDFTDGVGTGGESIYGEKFQVRASHMACNWQASLACSVNIVHHEFACVLSHS